MEYVVYFKEVTLHRVYVEADSPEQARAMVEGQIEAPKLTSQSRCVELISTGDVTKVEPA